MGAWTTAFLLNNEGVNEKDLKGGCILLLNGNKKSETKHIILFLSLHQAHSRHTPERKLRVMVKSVKIKIMGGQYSQTSLR